MHESVAMAELDEVFDKLREALEEGCAGYGVDAPALELNRRLRTSAGRFRWQKRGDANPRIELASRHVEAFGFGADRLRCFAVDTAYGLWYNLLAWPDCSSARIALSPRTIVRAGGSRV